MKRVITFKYKLDLPFNIKVRIKVFHISVLKPVLKKVLLKKKIKINTNKDSFNIKEV